MRGTHFALGTLGGVILALALLLIGGIGVTPAAPQCAKCVVLSHAWGGCNEQVANGWVCP